MKLPDFEVPETAEFALEAEPSSQEPLTQHVGVSMTLSVSDATLSSVASGSRVWTGPDEEDYRPVTLGDMVADKLVQRVTRDPGWEGIRRRITEISKEEILEQVRPLIAYQLDKGFPKTNQYGEPVAGTTTLSELIMAEVRKVLTQRADTYDSKRTVLQKMVADAVTAEFAKVIKEQVDTVRKEIADEAANRVKDAVTAALKGR